MRAYASFTATNEVSARVIDNATMALSNSSRLLSAAGENPGKFIALSIETEGFCGCKSLSDHRGIPYRYFPTPFPGDSLFLLGAVRIGTARRAGLIEDGHVVSNISSRLAHPAHAAPFPVDRAVLAPAPRGARPVALALHGGEDIVVELRRLQGVADGLLR